MQFGQGSANFLVNSPQAVAQLVMTRLKLSVGEWFLDSSDGTPWIGDILGANTGPTRDAAIKSRILGTPGVTAITAYSGSVQGRAFTVTAQVQTLYGAAPISVTL
jgi:hypothetical protein